MKTEKRKLRNDFASGGTSESWPGARRRRGPHQPLGAADGGGGEWLCGTQRGQALGLEERSSDATLHLCALLLKPRRIDEDMPALSMVVQTEIVEPSKDLCRALSYRGDVLEESELTEHLIDARRGFHLPAGGRARDGCALRCAASSEPRAHLTESSVRALPLDVSKALNENRRRDAAHTEAQEISPRGYPPRGQETLIENPTLGYEPKIRKFPKAFADRDVRGRIPPAPGLLRTDEFGAGLTARARPETVSLAKPGRRAMVEDQCRMTSRNSESTKKTWRRRDPESGHRLRTHV